MMAIPPNIPDIHYLVIFAKLTYDKGARVFIVVNNGPIPKWETIHW